MSQKTIPIEKAVEIAAEMHRAGQFQRAEAMYREILRQDPGNVDAIHLLGVLANQGGRPDMAVELIKRALSRKPDEAVIHFNYAEALSANSQREDAVSHYRRAIELLPGYTEAINNLSKVLYELGRFEEAMAAGFDMLRVDKDNAVAHNNIGNALRGMNHNSQAIVHYQSAVKSMPDFPEALNNMGLAFASLGFFDEGIDKLKEALRLAPTIAEIHNNLGVVLANAGRASEAVVAFETTIKLVPEHYEAHNNLAAAFRTMGQMTEALKELEKALVLKPDSFAIQVNYAQTLKDLHRYDDALASVEKCLKLEPKSEFSHYLKGLIYRDQQKPDEAIDAFRVSLALAPHRADIQATLGYALQERGELDEALELLNKSIAAVADPQTHSNVMMVLCYHPNVSPAELYEAHRAYAKVHEDPIKANWKPHTNSRDPNRKIRVGYFSPDMRGHVVSYFSNPIFENHDHLQFEIYAYSNHFSADATTLMQRATFDKWRETAGMTPDKIAEMIREDQIDILVELAGHTALNGLPVLARKPAPVQLNGIGFPSTTGLTAVDYRITDALCDPIGVAEAYNSEKLLRLPDCFWCYQPPSEQIEIGPLPATKNGYVTFVSVNNFTKVTPQVLRLWAQIVAQVPGSKIILQTLGLSSAFVRGRVREIFKGEGVDESRIDMRTMTPFADYLRLLGSADIMLDTFPFNGGTTTCHGLWMSLPVVTLEGRTHAGRMGLSMLNSIGLPELCAKDEQGYLATAVSLAKDLPRLAAIRSGMRERLAASPLMDGPRYVRNLEAAYRRIWREWCEI